MASLTLPSTTFSINLSFEPNSDTGSYDSYVTESEKVTAYTDALTAIKSFTGFRGRVFKRDASSDLTFKNIQNITMGFSSTKQSNGLETLSIQWSGDLVEITPGLDSWFEGQAPSSIQQYLNIDLVLNY